MDHFYQSDVSQTPPAVPFPGSTGFVQSDVPVPAFTPTTPSAWWFNWYTESTRQVIVFAGLTPDPENLGQLLQAIQMLAAGSA